MSQQPQQPGWGLPPPPKTRKAWHETWWIVGLIGFLIGFGVASVGGGSDESGSQATETSIVFRDRDREVFTTFCADLDSATERKACEDVKAIQQRELEELKKKAAAASKPKPTTPPAPPAATIEEGTWAVPSEVKPGTYVSDGGESCYWARLRNTSGSLDSIIANSINPGRQRVTIRSTDKAFETTGCPTWRKVG